MIEIKTYLIEAIKKSNSNDSFIEALSQQIENYNNEEILESAKKLLQKEKGKATKENWWTMNYLRAIFKATGDIETADRIKQDLIEKWTQEKPDYSRHQIHFNARLELLDSSENARITAIASGYKPHIFYSDNGHSCSFFFDTPKLVFPGESVEVKAVLLIPESHRNMLYEGKSIRIQEGGRHIANAIVTQVIDKSILQVN